MSRRLCFAVAGRIPAAVCAGHHEAKGARNPPQPFGRQASIQDCRLRGHVGFCKSLIVQEISDENAVGKVVMPDMVSKRGLDIRR